MVLLVDVLVDGRVVKRAVAPVEEGVVPHNGDNHLPHEGRPMRDLPGELHAICHADVVQSEHTEELDDKVVNGEQDERLLH